MTAPSARVWLATFVGLVFTIGLLAGIVLERTVLRDFGSRGPGVQGARGPEVQGARGPGVQGARGPGGPGGGGGAQRGRGAGRGAMFGPPPAQYVEDLSQEVQLTDAQRTEILTLLQAQESRLQQMQDEARTVFIQEQAGLHDRIASILTAEQATTFRAWVARRTGPRGGGPLR